MLERVVKGNTMSLKNENKGRMWDGKSRIPTQQYKENYDEIFGKKTYFKKEDKRKSKNIQRGNHINKEKQYMFKFNLEIPTYAEWKVYVEKFIKDQPEQAKKYQEQVQKFWQDFFEDTFKIKK